MDVLQDIPFLLKHRLSAARDGGANGNQIPQSQHGPDKRAVGHWAAAGPRHSRCRTFIFWGSCGGPKGEGPSQAPKAVEGGGGRRT